MKSILIRNLDPGVYERLKRLAQLHHRSIQGELHAILEEAVRSAPVGDTAPLRLITVRTDGQSKWNRDEIYGDGER